MLNPEVARRLIASVGPNGKVGGLAARNAAIAIQKVIAANAARQLQMQAH